VGIKKNSVNPASNERSNWDSGGITRSMKENGRWSDLVGETNGGVEGMPISTEGTKGAGCAGPKNLGLKTGATKRGPGSLGDKRWGKPEKEPSVSQEVSLRTPNLRLQ